MPLFRVADLRRAIIVANTLYDTSDRIAIVTGEPGRMVLTDHAVATRGHCTRLPEASVTIASGERVLITGDSGDAQTALFRALAGLWPWGTGCIELPAEESFMHVARRPYVPPGRLRDVIAYPDDPAAFDDRRFLASLRAVGLVHLETRLDETARWDQMLGEQDVQRLAFARLALQRPRWVVIDQALDTLDATVIESIDAMFASTLKHAGIIAMGHDSVLSSRGSSS